MKNVVLLPHTAHLLNPRFSRRTLTGLSFCSPLFSLDSIPIDPFRSPVDMATVCAFFLLRIQVFPFSALSDAILIRPYHTAKSSAVSHTRIEAPADTIPPDRLADPRQGCQGRTSSPTSLTHAGPPSFLADHSGRDGSFSTKTGSSPISTHAPFSVP